MFSRQYRLHFRNKLNNPFVVHSSSFVLKFTKNDLAHNRYGFVIGKIVDKRSVYRNSIKRRLRAVIQELHPLLQQGYDMLFILKKDSHDKTYDEFHAEAETALQKFLPTKQ